MTYRTALIAAFLSAGLMACAGQSGSSSTTPTTSPQSGTMRTPSQTGSGMSSGTTAYPSTDPRAPGVSDLGRTDESNVERRQQPLGEAPKP